VHEGTVRFERGDSTLRNETSVNTDLALRVQTQNLSAEVGGYVNYIEDFIFPNPTGQSDPESGFQIFEITQGNARLAGFEAAADYHPIGLLHLRLTADYTNGQNTTTDKPVPFIPPFRVTYEAKVEGELERLTLARPDWIRRISPLMDTRWRGSVPAPQYPSGGPPLR
jgi:iron complex outermembrane receptor protein